MAERVSYRGVSRILGWQLDQCWHSRDILYSLTLTLTEHFLQFPMPQIYVFIFDCLFVCCLTIMHIYIYIHKMGT